MMVDAYEQGIEFKNFPDLEERMNQYYDRIYDTTDNLRITPRYLIDSGMKITQRDIFYYINRLYDNNPSSVIDVGCGECTWKRWFPNIIGFDPIQNEFSQQDFVDTFNEDFSQKHTKLYQCGMALNSIHFIEWKDISKTIDMAMNIVQDRFLFTFNFDCIQNKPGSDGMNRARFDDIIVNTRYKIIMIDYPSRRQLSHSGLHNAQAPFNTQATYLNGHVRFILAHNN